MTPTGNAAIRRVNRELSGLLSRRRHPRLRHLRAVARLAGELGRRHGGVTAGECRAAAFLHDWLKPCPRSELRRLRRELGVRLDAHERQHVSLWHGPLAAGLAERRWSLAGSPVLPAVRWHTTGRPGASRLERIVFVADYTAVDRRHPEAATGRALARRHLGLAVRFVLSSKLDDLARRGAKPHPAAVGLWRELMREASSA